MKRFALLLVVLGTACAAGPDGDGTAGGSLDTSAVGGDGKADGNSVGTTVCADGQVTTGIDVSVYQGTIDWAKAKAAGTNFAFIRVSDGVNTKDTKFATNWAATKAAGVIRGAYQFFRPSQNIDQQADLMIAAIGTYQHGDLPPVLDVETAGVAPATLASDVQAWVTRVQAGVGVTPIVYTGVYFWRDDVGSAPSQSPLWLAQYTTGCPAIPAPWKRWTFWQNSGSGTMAGITGAVDLDKFNGSLDQLVAFAQGTPLPPPSPPPPPPPAPTAALPFSWTDEVDGSRTLHAQPPAGVTQVEMLVDGASLGTASVSSGEADLNFNLDDGITAHVLEVRGLDMKSTLVAVGNGLIDGTDEPEIYVDQTAASEYEVGLESPSYDVATIEVTDGGSPLTDATTGQVFSSRAAVRCAFQSGDHALEITSLDSGGNEIAVDDRTLHVP